MKDYVIFTDSSCDLPNELVAEWGVEVLSLEVTIDGIGTFLNHEIEPEKFDVHDYFRNFCRAIDGEEEMLVKHDEARLVMRVMELAVLSAEQGTTVDFSF